MAARALPIVPTTRAGCAELARPCSVRACRHHLDRGSSGCSLDEAERHPDGMSLAEIGEVLGLSVDAVHRVERIALHVFARRSFVLGVVERLPHPGDLGKAPSLERASAREDAAELVAGDEEPPPVWPSFFGSDEAAIALVWSIVERRAPAPPPRRARELVDDHQEFARDAVDDAGDDEELAGPGDHMAYGAELDPYAGADALAGRERR